MFLFIFISITCFDRLWHNIAYKSSFCKSNGEVWGRNAIFEDKKWYPGEEHAGGGVREQRRLKAE